MLGEGPIDDVNDKVGAAKKKFSINFTKAKARFCLSLHCHGDNGYLLVNTKKFKVNNDNYYPGQFRLRRISKKFVYVEFEKISLKRMCMIFQSITMLLINMPY